MNNVFVTKKDQLVDNMKKSHRGGIRKQPNVLSWVAGLNKLTDDDGEVVREWNAKSAKSNQLVGAKAQTIKYLITLTDKETLDILMKIVLNMFENMVPEEVVSTLNDYFTEMIDIVFKYNSRGEAFCSTFPSNITAILSLIVSASS